MLSLVSPVTALKKYTIVRSFFRSPGSIGSFCLAFTSLHPPNGSCSAHWRSTPVGLRNPCLCRSIRSSSLS